MTTNAVRDFYGQVTETATGTGQYNARVAEAFGYSTEELSAIPSDANLGLSCGNPIATANLKEGETFVDLGSGAGIDVFLAARKVGERGKAIGVDMTDKMLDLAKRNSAKGGYTNVEFVKSRITAIALPDASADIVSSNCVINLVPHAEKPLVFREIFRVLKPGGRMAVSDILTKTDLPDFIREDLTLYVGCIAGAAKPGEYDGWMREAGFEDIAIVDTQKDLNVYQSDKESVGCCGKGSTCGTKKESEEKATNIDFNEYVGSFQIYAVKP
uniref:Arsenite methyltransferase n=2 Tax=Schizophyllum commune (strain H4-8 / FGSC 9210) TaxID=578458 RepID=D8PLB1_SCHCM